MAVPKDWKKTIAILTLHEVYALRLSERRELANWLHDQANQVVETGGLYCKKYQARFYEAK